MVHRRGGSTRSHEGQGIREVPYPSLTLRTCADAAWHGVRPGRLLCGYPADLRDGILTQRHAAPMTAMQEQMEQKIIARECPASLGRALEWYRSHFKMTTEEAIARMNENAEEVAQQILQRPPDEIQWHDLDHVGRLDPAKALGLWEEIQTQALEELRSGHQLAKTMHSVANHPQHGASVVWLFQFWRSWRCGPLGRA